MILNLNDTDFTSYIEKVKAINGAEKRKIYICTFGCQQNEADSEKLLGMAEALGYVSSSPEDAALILVNTCAVREHAEEKVLSVIGGLKKYKEKNQCLIGVCGCMTAQEHRKEQLKRSYPYVDFTLDPSSFHRLCEVLGRRLSGAPRIFLRGDSEAKEIPEGLPCKRKTPHRGWLSIMYGCNNFCSYCIVPYVRGRERSRLSRDILEEARQMIADGCRDITLLGQNVNSYRGDVDFPTLLKMLGELPGDFVLRFMTSHPKDVSPHLIEEMGKNPKLAPAFHLPLQSGSDRILAAMNRRYDKARYRSIVKGLREVNPDLMLTTDIIVGFPGETEEDFSETLELLREFEFDLVYSFLYSRRRTTPASEMADQVPEAVKKERMGRLLALQTEISAARARRFLSRTLPAIMDAPGEEEGTFLGRTVGGKPVLVQTKLDASLILGRWINVKIIETAPFTLKGEIVEV